MGLRTNDDPVPAAGGLRRHRRRDGGRGRGPDALPEHGGLQHGGGGLLHQDGAVWEATLRCDYVPEGETTVEVLSPETIAGVKAVLSDGEAALEYEDQCLNAGTLSSQDISPMACLPQLMSALRDGWLLEENTEDWQETPCVRLTVDQTGAQDGKILSTLWLRQEDSVPLRGEIAVDGEIILTADFTSFSFYDTINNQE